MTKDFQLTSQPIPGLIRQLAVPASVGFFFNTMYNMVDTYFAGLISTGALAALSLSFPVFFIVVAMGSGLGTGATALMATALGANRREEARQLSCQALSFGVAAGIILTLLGIYLSPYLFRFLGADGDYLVTGLEYIVTIFMGTVFFMIIYMLNAILNALGDTRSFRNFLIIGFLLNCVLDPWFIYGGFGLPKLGVAGIALATVLVQVVGCLYLGFKVRETGLCTGLGLRNFIPRLSCFRDIARQGFPASLNMVTVGLGIFVITYFVSRFGKEGVAAYGIAVRVEQMILLPTIGLNVATLTIVAQNHGAGLYSRIYETLAKALKYGGILMGAGTLILLLLSRFVMSLFTDDPEVIRHGTNYLRIDALLLYAYVILFVHVAALQGVKKPMFAVWIGLYRQIAAPLVVFYLFSFTLGLGVTGVWWGIFVINWSAVAVTFFYSRRLLRQVTANPPVSV